MNLLTPNLLNANGAKVVANSLFESSDPGFLTQDLLLVELPGETYIDVSWFPEHDPSGAYTVSVFRAHMQLAELETKNALDAVKIVERWAMDLSQGIAAVPGTTAEVNVSPCGSVGPLNKADIVSCSSVQTTNLVDYSSAA